MRQFDNPGTPSLKMQSIIQVVQSSTVVPTSFVCDEFLDPVLGPFRDDALDLVLGPLFDDPLAELTSTA
jgi:hypothetical protein